MNSPSIEGTTYYKHITDNSIVPSKNPDNVRAAFGANRDATEHPTLKSSAGRDDTGKESREPVGIWKVQIGTALG